MNKNDLFISSDHDKIASNKDNWVQLPLDPKLWESEILSIFYSDNPEFLQTPVSIKIKPSRTPDKTGTLILSNSLMLPLIVKDNMLAPLDIAVFNNSSILPFDSEVKQIFLSKRNKTLTKQDVKDYVLNLDTKNITTAPEVMSKYASDKLKSYQMIDPGGFAKLAFITELPVEEIITEKEINLVERPQDIFGQLVQSGTDYVYHGFNGFDTQSINIPKEDFLKIANQIDPDILCFTEAPKHIDNNKYLATEFKTPENKSIYVSADRSYTTEFEKIGSIRDIYFTSSRPEMRSCGFFILENNEITEPMHITKIAETAEVNIISGISLSKGLPVNYILTKGLNKVATIKNEDAKKYDLENNSSFYIPFRSKYLKLADEKNYLDESLLKSANTLEVSNSKYFIEGPIVEDLEKLSIKSSHLSKSEMIWALLNANQASDVIKIATLMTDSDKIGIPNAKLNIKMLEKIAEEEIIPLKTTINSSNFLKIASAVGNSDPSLAKDLVTTGFLDTKNVKNLKKETEPVKVLRQKLVEILLAIRINEININETLVIDTIKNLTLLINELKTLS